LYVPADILGILDDVDAWGSDVSLCFRLLEFDFALVDVDLDLCVPRPFCVVRFLLLEPCGLVCVSCTLSLKLQPDNDKDLLFFLS
jgi:hypothetical protein